jgi:RluA family pseudouridine synthase
LPGSVPYDNERPLNVPQRFDGCSLVDFLDRYHPHVGREWWLAECRAGRLRQNRQPLGEDRIVRAGESLVHLCPATVEPDVDAGIRILYEDDVLVVVDKPAPLPVHACGRYHRNTLLFLLNNAYAPQRLRPAHRLDANTSGLMILSRSRAWAARLQPQFQQGRVEKQYLVKVWGDPPRDEFECDLAVGDAPTRTGARIADADGSAASTRFRVLRRDGSGASLLLARPRTGRTNQIRVHLWSLGMPVVGDPTYLPERRLGAVQTLRVDAPRMYLHAWRIGLTHPRDERPLDFESPRDW